MSYRSQSLTVESEPFDLSNSVATDVLTSKYFANDRKHGMQPYRIG